MKANTFLTWLAGALTLALTGISYAISYSSLAGLAKSHNLPIYWLFPAVVEVGVFVFSLVALAKYLSGEKAAWQWVLVVSSSFTAMALNIAHAPADILSRFMFALPSVFTLLSFECFLELVKHGVSRSNIDKNLAELEAYYRKRSKEIETALQQEQAEIEADLQAKEKDWLATLQSEFSALRASLQIETQDLQNDLEAKLAELDATQAELDLTKAELARQLDALSKAKMEAKSVKEANKAKPALPRITFLTVDQRRQAIVSYVVDNGDASAQVLAEMFGVTRQTISTDINHLIGEGMLHRNGNGLEVTGDRNG